MNTLTTKQQRVLVAIKEFVRTKNRMPTRQELANILGYKSVNSIQQYLSVLKIKGYLNINKNKSRGVVVEDDKINIISIPLVGSVPCGTPVLAEENIEAYVPVDTLIIHNKPKDYFFLKAFGDSMDDEGIDDGDLLLIESKPTANPGEIVLALIGDEATIKIYKPNKDYIALVPKSKNPVHKPIILTNDVVIQGVVRKVIKRRGLDV